MATSDETISPTEPNCGQTQPSALSLSLKVLVSTAGMVAMLFLSGCGEGHDTQLRRKSEQMHSGMSFTQLYIDAPSSLAVL